MDGAVNAVQTPAFYTKAQLDSIRQKYGQSLQQEKEIRIRNTRHLTKIAKHLGLPYYSTSTCLYLYHRFAASYDLSKFSVEHVLISCLSLGMKIEETVKKLGDIYMACNLIINGISSEPTIQDLRELKDTVIDLERLLLEDIQFDVKIDPPHRLALSFCKMANSDSSVAEECWEILNSSYQSTICIQYPTHLISFASVYLAYQLTFLEIPPAIRSFELLTKCCSKIGEIIGNQPTKVDVVIDIIDLLKSLSSSPEELKNYDRITQNLLELKIEQVNEGNQELIKVHKLPEKRRIEEQKTEGEKRSRHDRNDKRPFERQHDRATYDRPVERPHAGYDRYERNGDWERREFRREEYPQRGTAREEFREIPHRREEYPEPVNSYPPRYREYQHPPREIQRPVDPREFRDRHREPPRDYQREYRGKRPQEYRQYDREYRR